MKAHGLGALIALATLTLSTTAHAQYGAPSFIPLQRPPSVAVGPLDPLIVFTQATLTPPVGVLTNVDLARGIGFVAVPGVGGRIVAISGRTIATPAGPAVVAVDGATGLSIVAMLPPSQTPQGAAANTAGMPEEGSAAVVTIPSRSRSRVTANPGPLTTAMIRRVTADGVIVTRKAGRRRITEILPRDRVYADVRGNLVLAANAGRLRPGERVWIPIRGGARGTIVFNP